MANKKKKPVKKPVKKVVVKKAVKKPVKKPVKKAASKPAKKPAKKVIQKPTKKSATKKAAPKKVVAGKVKAKAIAVKLSPPVNVDYSKAITPLGDRLVVKVSVGDRVTAGGLIIPDTVSSVAVGHLKAVVLAVGNGGKNKKGNVKPLDVKVGDTVLFSEHAGTKVSFNSEELQIIHESDVMGIVQN